MGAGGSEVRVTGRWVGCDGSDYGSSADTGGGGGDSLF